MLGRFGRFDTNTTTLQRQYQLNKSRRARVLFLTIALLALYWRAIKGDICGVDCRAVTAKLF